MASGSSAESQLQIRLLTKQNIYAVADSPLSVPNTVNCESLSELVNQLLKETNENFTKHKNFDFVINGELLRESLLEHLESRHLSIESTIEVEYFERVPSPEPQDSLLHDDWISGIHTSGSWVLTGCYDHSVNVSTTHGKLITRLMDHENAVKAVTWMKVDNPSAGFISVSQDARGIIWGWDASNGNGRPVAYLRGHERGIECVGVSPNTQRLATAGWDTHLKIWSTSLEPDGDEHVRKKFKGSGKDNVITKTPLNTLQGHKECVTSAIWMDDHNIITGSMDHTIKIWDAELCGIKNEIVAQKAVLNASWSPLTQMLITSSADRHIRLYDPRVTQGVSCQRTFTSHEKWVSSVTWSGYNENLFLSGGYDSLVKVWDTRSHNAPLYDLQGHVGQVLCVDFTNNKYIVSGGTDNFVHIFRNKHV